MTTDLDRLIEAVEAGTLTEHECLSNGTRLPMCASTWAAYCGSLDAAVALLEALLPRWEFRIGLTNSVVFLRTHKGSDPTASGASEVTSRALLLATLRAYRSTGEGET